MRSIINKLLPICIFLLLIESNLVAGVKAASSTIVSIDLYVMSLCPFGIQAENVLIPAVKSLGRHADLKIHYIAKESTSPANSMDLSGNFKALHGKPEVEENIRQLCVSQHYPKAHLNYILERNKDYRGTNWQDAAKKAGADPKKIDICVNGEDGAALLRENIKKHIERKAFSSPTIDIDGKHYKGTRGQKSLTLAMCEALKEKGSVLPKGCQEADAMPPDPAPGSPATDACGGGPSGEPFDIQVITDKACQDCGSTLNDSLKSLNPNATIKTVDISSAEGQALVKRHKVHALPLYVLDKKVEKDPNFASLINFIYVKSADGYVVRMGSSTYMPTVQMDRSVTPRHLDLFVQALSPASYQVESELFDFMQSTKIKDMTFSIHFIVQEIAKLDEKTKISSSLKSVRSATLNELSSVSTGPITAAGGKEEAQESLRQVCLFQKASMGTFFSYLACRSQNLKDPAQGERCFTPEESVATCMEKGEGESLLRQDAHLVNALRIGSGPQILWENRYGPFRWNEVDWKAMIERNQKTSK